MSKPWSLLGVLLSVVILSSVSAVLLAVPLKLDGNVDYIFTRNENDGGSQSDSSNLVLGFNARTYLWRPWLGTLNVGGVGSIAKTDADTVDSDTKLLSSRLLLKLLPRSRYPFHLTFNSSDNVIDWVNRDKPLLTNLGTEYRSRFFNVRQSYITLGGNRVDGWYSYRLRGIDENGSNKDGTLGMKVKWRLKDQNFYFKGTKSARKQTEIENKIDNNVLSLTHQYVPSSEFYIKSLVTNTNVQNETQNANGSFLRNTETDVRQAASFFYWRPAYKPMSMTGAVRIQTRTVDFFNDSSVDDQSHFFANLASNYQINRKAKLTATANVTSLDTERSNRLASNQSISANYRSDRYMVKGMDYYWYSSGGVGNEVEAQFDDTNLSHNINAGIGHNVHRRWIVGNRSTLTANVTQALREFVAIESFRSFDSFDASLTMTNSGSVTWKDGRTNRGSLFGQVSFLDARSFDQDIDSQIITAQISHTKSINRLSSYGGHLTVQSTRRNTTFFERKRFLTTSTGRLNYRHQRVFGIYRLKFKGKFDVSTTANREGGDRKQWRLEGRLSYAVGLLNTSVLGRWVNNDIGLGSKLLVLQLSRRF